MKYKNKKEEPKIKGNYIYLGKNILGQFGGYIKENAKNKD